MIYYFTLKKEKEEKLCMKTREKSPKSHKNPCSWEDKYTSNSVVNKNVKVTQESDVQGEKIEIKNIS